jgi:Flp pilus assembly protein TadG
VDVVHAVTVLRSGRRPARTARRALGAHGRGDRGTAAVETAIIAPGLVVLLLLVMLAARVSQADAEVQAAATAAARAASLQATPARATSEATEVVDESLEDAGLSCSSRDVSVDTRFLAPGGSVRVTVECTAELSEMILLEIPTAQTFESSATEVVDTYRGLGDP